MEKFEIGQTVYVKNTDRPMTVVNIGSLKNSITCYYTNGKYTIENVFSIDCLTKTPYTPPQNVAINGTILENEGKTLRDEIAMCALQGMLANPQASGGEQDYARWAYQYADAMLEARGQK